MSKQPLTKYQEGMCGSCEALCCTDEVGRIDVWENDRKNVSDSLINFVGLSIDGLEYEMKKTKDGKCICLDENKRCKIYSDRPGTCKGFPVLGAAKIGFCPYKKRENI